MEKTLFDRISRDITGNNIVLYMKGTPVFPQDGYSAVVAEALHSFNVPFLGVDVLEDPDLYKALKEFSNWPSVPQLYIKGTFVGGSDTVKEMKASGELRKLLCENGLL